MTDLQAFGEHAAGNAASLQRYAGYLATAGAAIARLHDSVPPSSSAAAIDGYRLDHLRTVRAWCARPAPSMHLWPAVGFVQRKRVPCALGSRSGRCLCGNSATDLPVGLVHGDCYPANFVLNAEDHSVHVIDLHTLLWSSAPEEGGTKRGMADVREDIGRFCEALRVQGLRLGLSEALVRDQEQAFLQAYMQNQPAPRRTRLHAHEAFFRLRYDAVIFRAWHLGQQGKTSEPTVRLADASAQPRTSAPRARRLCCAQASQKISRPHSA